METPWAPSQGEKDVFANLHTDGMFYSQPATATSAYVCMKTKGESVTFVSLTLRKFPTQVDINQRHGNNLTISYTTFNALSKVPNLTGN